MITLFIDEPDENDLRVGRSVSLGQVLHCMEHYGDAALGIAGSAAMKAFTLFCWAENLVEVSAHGVHVWGENDPVCWLAKWLQADDQVVTATIRCLSFDLETGLSRPVFEVVSDKFLTGVGIAGWEECIVNTG